MTDGKQERLPLLPAGCRQSTSGAATALSIDRSMTKRNSRLVADAQLSGAESRCRIWASTVEGASSRVFWRHVVFENSRRRVSDMKRACILTECARGQATGIACFGKMMAGPAAAIVWRLRCGRIGRCRAWRVTAPGLRGRASRWAHNVTSSEVDWITHPDTCFPRATLTRGLRFPGLESHLAWGQMRRASPGSASRCSHPGRRSGQATAPTFTGCATAVQSS